MNAAGSVSMLAPPHQTADLNALSDAGVNTRAVAQQVESVFLQMLIKQMRESGTEEGLFPADKSDTFGVMFDQFIAEQVASSQGIGLATYIESATHRYSSQQATTEDTLTNGAK